MHIRVVWVLGERREVDAAKQHPLSETKRLIIKVESMMIDTRPKPPTCICMRAMLLWNSIRVSWMNTEAEFEEPSPRRADSFAVKESNRQGRGSSLLSKNSPSVAWCAAAYHWPPSFRFPSAPLWVILSLFNEHDHSEGNERSDCSLSRICSCKSFQASLRLDRIFHCAYLSSYVL